MKVIDTPLLGCKIIEPQVFGDERGFFMENWNRQRYAEAGIDVGFVQSNLSSSAKDVLRGLHFQYPNPQGKLVSVLSGEVLDVAVDVRKNSPTFGSWTGVVLSGENKKQFYVPEGFAHGFVVLSDTAMFSYLCTRLYAPECEHSLLWNDPAIGIDWSCDAPQLSAKDQQGRLLSTFSDAELPVFTP
ncbi:dTDP-4-dehydrorhamnose 3,5-epimerase [Marinicella sp. W31]|uniref:dTDP-4-dehydrorhamnose 3,5-epimerase n=1 Tax=Marinicella sp. W31 TaxID=3023713 RepID=UPI00375707E2